MLLFLDEAERERRVQREAAAHACELLHRTDCRRLKGHSMHVTHRHKVGVEAEGGGCVDLFIHLFSFMMIPFFFLASHLEGKSLLG